MSATAPAPARATWGAWRVALVILGSIVVLAGAGLLVGGGALGVLHLTQRDDDGFLESPREQVSSDGYAVTAEGIDIADLDDGGDWLVEQGLGRVRIRATSRTDAIFVGIAREADLDRYLATTAHDELREVRSGADRYVSRDGGALPVVPAEAGIWVASAAGEGTQSVEWDARDGRWAVAVMNADGARAVAADVSVGAKVGVLPWVAGGLLLAGLLLVAVGAGLIGAAARGQVATAPVQAEEAGVPPGAYPVAVDGRLDTGLSRWLWLVKWLLAIPHYLILALLWIAFGVLTIVALIAVVATGRYPRAIFDFNVGVLRWTWRVGYYSYGALGTDRYPPFTLGPADYPATLEVPYPEHLSRGKALVKWWLLAIPHYIVLTLLAWGWTIADDVRAPSLLAVLVAFAAIALLFTGRYPRDIFRLVIGINRWAFRVVAYAALMRDEYPPFRLDP
jgi:Domain of unknown function (DUF4389)